MALLVFEFAQLGFRTDSSCFSTQFTRRHSAYTLPPYLGYSPPFSLSYLFSIVFLPPSFYFLVVTFPIFNSLRTWRSHRVLSFLSCPSRLSAAVMSKTAWGGRGLFHSTVCSPSWRKVKAETQGMNPRARTEAEVTEAWCLLACSPGSLSLLPNTTQGQLPRDGLPQSGLRPSTSDKNQEKAFP